MNIEAVKIDMPEGCNLIFGMSHFIKTVEDLHELMVNSVPGVKFGVAFSEASGDRLVRFSGNDNELATAAAQNSDENRQRALFPDLHEERFPGKHSAGSQERL